MQIEAVQSEPAGFKTPLLVCPRLQSADLGTIESAIDDLSGGALTRVIANGDFTGRKDATALLYATDGAPFARVLLVGLGSADTYGPEQLRRALGTAVRRAEQLGVTSLAVTLDHVVSGTGTDLTAAASVAAEAATLAAWNYRELKTVSDPDNPVTAVQSLTLFVADAQARAHAARGVSAGGVIGQAANQARELAARPGNYATPTHLAETARAIASEYGLEVSVLDREDMQREGMHGLLAVARGTQEEPRFIALEYRGGASDEKPLVLVGKGVTFDAGGISLKPPAKMEEMKYDMSGAAAVLGAMRGIAALALKANVVGLVPSTENLPSGTAVKPGDVIGSHLGKTVEVINTDAEGRLILMDALSYARRYEPAAVVDAATLTGAVVIGLGHHAIGLMGTDEALIGEIRDVGARTGERCWPLPLWDEYRRQLDSDVADIKNTGGRPAGSITAGWFLKEFVGELSWAHLDIAGTAYRDENPPYLRKGPTGAPTRLFIEWVRGRSGA